MAYQNYFPVSPLLCRPKLSLNTEAYFDLRIRQMAEKQVAKVLAEAGSLVPLCHCAVVPLRLFHYIYTG
jgi:hypothetical protein